MALQRLLLGLGQRETEVAFGVLPTNHPTKVFSAAVLEEQKTVVLGVFNIHAESTVIGQLRTSWSSWGSLKQGIVPRMEEKGLDIGAGEIFDCFHGPTTSS